VCNLTCRAMVSSRGCVEEMGLFQNSEPFLGPRGMIMSPTFI
jgi:hypothetical protein